MHSRDVATQTHQNGFPVVFEVFLVLLACSVGRSKPSIHRKAWPRLEATYSCDERLNRLVDAKTGREGEGRNMNKTECLRGAYPEKSSIQSHYLKDDGQKACWILEREERGAFLDTKIGRGEDFSLLFYPARNVTLRKTDPSSIYVCWKKEGNIWGCSALIFISIFFSGK